MLIDIISFTDITKPKNNEQLHNLQVTTFNCHGFKTSIHDICNMCAESDIILLQELWLTQNEICQLKSVHPEFDGCGISSIDDQSGVLSGRPYGGIGILWRKSMSHACSVITYDDSRLIGINVHTNNGKYLILNVYLPYQSHDNYDEYCHYIGLITAIVNECDTCNVIICGDFNADVGTHFETELLSMCDKADLIISDYDRYGRSSDIHTYVSAAHNSTSWLDHVICSYSANASPIDIKVDDLPPSSDHCPVHATFNTHTVAVPDKQLTTSITDPDNIHPTFNWVKAQPSDVRDYSNWTRDHLSHVSLPEVTGCTDVNCSIESHRKDLDILYDDICTALRASSLSSIPQCRNNNSRNYVIPGWNDYVKDAHQEARSYYLLWRNMGKPRQGPACELMRRSRLNFKYALRQCQN